MKYSGNFFRNKDGAIISIEFVFCVFLFTALMFIIYDGYSVISLKNKLERVNYAAASIFRERTALYPVINDRGKCFNLCDKSRELFDDTQAEELRQMASELLNREVSIKIDVLLISQDTSDPNFPSKIEHAKLKQLSSAPICSSNSCGDAINYFNSLSSMEDSTNYVKFIPYVRRNSTTGSGQSLTGRWIPLYRVSMCVKQEESLFLRLTNSSGGGGFGQSICTSTMVLSRCNDMAIINSTCPMYAH
jgi:tight adherence protein F